MSESTELLNTSFEAEIQYQRGERKLTIDCKGVMPPGCDLGTMIGTFIRDLGQKGIFDDTLALTITAKINQ